MSIYEKAKIAVREMKEQQKERKSPFALVLEDPEVKKTARYLATHLRQNDALEKLNEILLESGKLPLKKDGTPRSLNRSHFLQLLPKRRQRRTGEDS